jgi:exonuclease SbcC
MRIRVIRGKNLASLAGEFVVDFAAQPLASAGVFAISGPTGAGKSTLLDAMCLALYHETPRLKAAQELNVAIPDVHDSSITPRDPRNLLRRGCGEGWAEVEFEDRGGVVWRARWSVARARGKPDGRLQPASAELVRCADQQRFDGKLGEIQHKLVELTGLSFEQFCRSVLLAQNEFAALLKARQNERADLLEALTGSEIFQRLSTLAHERNSEEQRQLQALEQDLKLSLPLSDEQRAELDQRVSAAAVHAAQLRTQLANLHTEQRWHIDGERLAQRLALAKAEHAQMQAQLLADAGLQRQLRCWAAVAPLRPLLDASRQAIHEQQQLLAQLPALEDVQARAVAAHHAAIAAAERSAVAAELALQQRESARALIAAARAADARVRQAAAALAAARIEQGHAAAQVQGIHEQLAECLARRAQRQLEIAQWTDWQTGHPQFAQVGDLWAALGPRLDAALQLQQRLADAQARHTALDLAVDAARIDVEAAEQALAQARDTADTAASDLEQAEQRLAGFDAETLDARRDAWELRQRSLHALQAALRATQDCVTREQRLAQAFAEAQTALPTLRQASLAAADALTQAGRESELAGVTFERASLLAHAHTERLRALLVDGKPCPVCGSSEHPMPGASNADARGLLDLLGNEAARTRQQLDQAIASVATSDSELAAGERACVAAALAHRNAVEELAGRNRELRVLAAPMALAEATLDAISAAMPRLFDELSAQADALQQARATWLAARNALALAGATARDALQQVERARERLAAALLALAPQRAALDAAQGECAALLAEFERLWTPLSALPGMRELAPPQLNALLQAWRDGESVRQRAEQAVAAQRELDTDQARLNQATAHAQTTLDRLQQTSHEAATALQQAQAERAAALADADVEAFAERLDADAAAAVAAHDRQQQSRHHAELAVQRSEAERRRCHEQAADRLQQHQGLQQQLQQALDEIRDELGADPSPLADWIAAIDSCPADLAARQAAWAQRERACAARQAHVVAAQHEIDHWRSAARSARPRAEVDAALEIADGAHAQAQRELGAVAADQRADEQRRQQNAEKMAALQARRAAVRRWALLDELIGARDGSRFKRYAQQFTLEVLIEFANEHLVHLARRYRLRRGSEALSLLVIDGDLADEVRSVHSLSGGETFLVSLALALGLASLSSQRLRVESLFIDEGFGSLDADTLNTAMEALDRLQAQGRRVGVISHVHEMAERIGVQVRVEPVGAGRSRVVVLGQG